ncbi:unnamed protein product [Gadus morhua 'NCC']
MFSVAATAQRKRESTHCSVWIPLVHTRSPRAAGPICLVRTGRQQAARAHVQSPSVGVSGERLAWREWNWTPRRLPAPHNIAGSLEVSVSLIPTKPLAATRHRDNIPHCGPAVRCLGPCYRE